VNERIGISLLKTKNIEMHFVVGWLWSLLRVGTLGSY
jgi:hypothetical protein